MTTCLNCAGSVGDNAEVANNRRATGRGSGGAVAWAALVGVAILGMTLGASTTAFAQPTLSKTFSPSTIGPGSVSTVTWTITNGGASPVTGLTFTDLLPTVPGDVDIADPANASTSCLDGIVGAPAGGGTITFSGGRLGGGATCTVTVDVTASTAGVHTNPAIALSYDGLAGTPPASLPIDLTVVTSLPGFSKSFAPSSVAVGGRSTLTFTFDNAANAGPVGNLDLVDVLPFGMTLADPANAVTDCISAAAPDTTLTAVPGTGVVALDASGSTFFPGFEVLPAGATCTATVEVTATGSGTFHNVTNDLLADFVVAGKASATLEATVTPLAIQKAFTDDPTPPGANATLEFRIDNFDRDFSAVGVAFTDDLATFVPTIPGITFGSLLSNDCGGSVTGVGGTLITFSGGTIAAEGFCTVRVTLAVPAGATPGTSTNTTSTVTGTVNGSPVVGNMASDDLFVEPVPLLTKEFLDATTLLPNPVVNPGATGEDVVIRFTVTNTSTTSGATAIAFSDELTDGGPSTGFFPFPLSATLPTTPCGAGSTLGFVFPDTERQGLELTGGTLDPAPGAGATCTFDVTVTVPAGFPPGVYVNTTQALTATVDGATRIGAPASDTLTVIAAPSLTKTFADDPVAPGATVTLEFTLEHSPNAATDATDITFTDDLAALTPTLVGLTASFPPTPDPPCGAGSMLTGSAGDTLLTLMGGTLAPGGSCTFSVTLNVPAGTVSGTFTNTTSPVSATVSGVTATAPAAAADLEVGGLLFSKEFLGNPAFPGKTLTLRFTLENIGAAATAVGFTDSLFSVAALVATDPALADDCGGTLDVVTIPGFGSFLTYSAGSLAAGATCNLDVEVMVPATSADGVFENVTSSVSYMLGATPGSDPPAIDDLIVSSDQLLLLKEFTDDPVSPGDSVTLDFTLSNLDTANAASVIAFTDDFGAALPGVTFDSVVLNDCGAGVAGLGTDTLAVTGAALAAGGSCTIRVSLTVPGGAAANGYSNTTSGVTGEIGGFPVSGDAASDILQVVDLLLFSKSFDGPTTATGSAILTFTVTNPRATTASGLSFSDNLDDIIAGLIVTNLLLDVPPCGAGSTLSGLGTSLLTFTGGELAPLGGTCSFRVEVTVPATASAGTFPNTTSALFQSGLAVADPATAGLVIEPPPTFAKVFAPDTIPAGGVSTLTFTVDNAASALAASAFTFTDNLPAGVVIADPTNAATTCTGMGDASIGAASFTFAGGAVGAGASCTIQFDVTSSTAGAHVNTTGDLVSTSGNSGTASDTLTVTPPPLPGFAKSFAPDRIVSGGVSTLTFVVSNTTSLVPATALGFSDTFPTGVVIADPTNASTTCSGGMGDATPGGTSFSFSGGTVGAGASCTIEFDVTSTAVGVHVNTTGDLTSSSGNSGTASDTLTVTTINFDKAFVPATIGPGSTTALTFTMTHVGSTGATGLAFTDTLPAGVVIATPASATTSCVDGTVSAPSGGGVISVSGGRLPVGATCTVTVHVTAPAAGSFVNISGDLTSSEGNSGAATATLTVDALRPGFIKTFVPSTIPPGGVSTLTLTIDNTANGVAATALAFADTLPAGMLLATPSDAVTGCGGTLTAAPGTGVILWSGGSIAATSSCTVTAKVTAASAGLYVNTTGELFSGTGPISSGFATAVLDVKEGFLTKSFTDDPVVPGGTVTLEFTINNPDRDNAASAIAFDDTLDPLGLLAGLAPSGSLPAVPCGTGSSLTFAGGVLSLAGGNVPASGSCTFSVLLAVPGTALAGIYTNTTDAISGTVNGSTVVGNMATDNLEVNTPPVLTKLFTGDPVGTGGTVTLGFTVTNTSTVSTATDIAFLDELTTFLPFPVTVTLPSVPSPPCGAGSSLDLVSLGTEMQGLSLTGGTLPISGACAFEVTLTLPVGMPAGTYINTTGVITGTVDGETVGGLPATDDLVVVAAPTLVKEFTDDPVAAGSSVTLAFTLAHDALAPGPATGISFTDDLAAVFSTTPELTATGLPLLGVCDPDGPGGVDGTGDLTGLAGDTALSFTGGSLAPGESCTFSVTLAVPATALAGSHTNTTSGVVASVLGVTATGNAAADDLQVSGLVLTKEFVDDPVVPGANVTLRFTIDNTSLVSDATAITFDDILDPVVLPGLTAVVLPPSPPCGAGSTLVTFTPAGFVEGLRLADGSLSAGASCSFDVTLTVPVSTASDIYPNTTTGFAAVMDGGPGTTAFANASDELVVSSELLLLTKEFTDDPIAPGATGSLMFTLSNLDASSAATGIAFTDDLDATLSGLLAIPPLDTGTCGGTLTGTSLLTYAGVSLAAGASCSFSVTVQVDPSSPQGTFTNTTSSVTGTIDGQVVTGDPAVDDLDTRTLRFTKSFDGPRSAGSTAVLTFTIENLNAATGVSGMEFFDDLDLVVAGLEATSLPTDPCGAGSAVTGTSALTFTGGTLLPGASCVFAVDVLIPLATAAGDYVNTTSVLATVPGGVTVADPASATLTVTNALLLTKAFINDPVTPGSQVTVEFILANRDATRAATGIAFSDDFGAALPGLIPVSLPTTTQCAIQGLHNGTNPVNFSLATLPAASSCTFSMTLLVPTGTGVFGSHTNTTSAVTGTIGGVAVSGAAATDILRVLLPLGPFVFTDDPLAPGVTAVRAIHFSELRAYVNMARVTYGLAAAVWTDDPLVAGVTPAKAVHLTELRVALDPVLVLTGIGAQAWLTDPASVDGLAIRAADLAQIRALLTMLGP